ncbi:hypothetical protein [Streptomyces sp. NPDC002685]|uniref:hypothetical protein n=1 Tax=Streptomyces sp. NPDC002685 TaxID=3154540 RepID=UPI00333169E4
MLVTRNLLAHYRGSEIHNEILHDDSPAFATDSKYPESDHAPVVATFDFAEPAAPARVRPLRQSSAAVCQTPSSPRPGLATAVFTRLAAEDLASPLRTEGEARLIWGDGQNVAGRTQLGPSVSS